MELFTVALKNAIDKHGSGIVLSVIEGLVKCHATHIEAAPHGLFVKMHYGKILFSDVTHRLSVPSGHQMEKGWPGEDPMCN